MRAIPNIQGTGLRPSTHLDAEDHMQPRITAAICAHNAGHFLRDIVASVMDQALPADQYEVLIIDNDSTDNTAEIVESLRQTYPDRLRIAAEPNRGLSNARNKALESAAAELVAFIDADAVADRDWLGSLIEVFDESPRAGVVGGTILVQWDQPRPRWWDSKLDEAMGFFRPADEKRRMEYPRYPYGGNFAVRREAIDQAGAYSPRLGRQGTRLLAGEEGELCLRIERAGWEIWFTPNAVVHHRTASHRLTRRFIVKRAFHHGRSQWMLESLHELDSGMYLSWPGIAWSVVRNVAGLNRGLPFLKYIAFRIGYHYQRTFGRSGNDPER